MSHVVSSAGHQGRKVVALLGERAAPRRRATGRQPPDARIHLPLAGGKRAGTRPGADRGPWTLPRAISLLNPSMTTRAWWMDTGRSTPSLTPRGERTRPGQKTPGPGREVLIQLIGWLGGQIAGRPSPQTLTQHLQRGSGRDAWPVVAGWARCCTPGTRQIHGLPFLSHRGEQGRPTLPIMMSATTCVAASSSAGDVHRVGVRLPVGGRRPADLLDLAHGLVRISRKALHLVVVLTRHRSPRCAHAARAVDGLPIGILAATERTGPWWLPRACSFPRRRRFAVFRAGFPAHGRAAEWMLSGQSAGTSCPSERIGATGRYHACQQAHQPVPIEHRGWLNSFLRQRVERLGCVLLGLAVRSRSRGVNNRHGWGALVAVRPRMSEGHDPGERVPVRTGTAVVGPIACSCTRVLTVSETPTTGGYAMMSPHMSSKQVLDDDLPVSARRRCSGTSR